MRIAIVGGTGSIGMATAARLVDGGMAVTILSRHTPRALPQGVSWKPVDVTDALGVQKALADGAFDRVVHLAALLQFACDSRPVEAMRVNLDGTLHVLEACAELRIRRVVFGSSIAVYGERSDAMRETDPMPDGVSLYGLTKRLGEALGQRFRELDGLEFVALRYSGVFGPGEATSAGMAQVRQRILQCAAGHDVKIDGASGDERSHLTHVDDAADATCAALLGECPPRAVYNVAGPAGNYVSLRELHGLVREIEPRTGEALWSGRARSVGPVDTARIRQDLGWAPRVSLRDGLAQLLSRESRASHAAA